MPDLADLPPSLTIGSQLLLIVVAALVGYFALRAVVDVSVRHLLERRAAESEQGVLPRAELERRVKTVGRLLVNIAGAVIAIIAVLMALDLFGIDIGPAIAGLGIAGIAVGLGAQTLVKDWLAGIFVVVENQYNQGDRVRVAGVEGIVEDFSLRKTKLRDPDGTIHTVPNGQIVVASNLSRTEATTAVDVDEAADPS